MRIVILLLCLNSAVAIKIGKLRNCSYEPVNQTPVIINRTTCSDCLCQAFTRFNSSQIILNCYENGRMCEIFFNYSSDYTLQQNSNSTFYFHPDLPPIINRTVSRIIPRWNATGTVIAGVSGIPGTSNPYLNLPYSVVFDSNGSLYVSEYRNHRVQRFMLGSSIGTVVVGTSNGIAGSSLEMLRKPSSMGFDLENGVYIVDSGNHRVLHWARGQSTGTIVAGTGSAGSDFNELDSPYDIVTDESTDCFYVSDVNNHRIMKFTVRNMVGSLVAGGNGEGSATNQLYFPYGFYLDKTTNSLYIANNGAHTIVRWNLGAISWTLVAGSIDDPGISAESLNAPTGICFDRLGNMYVADTNNHRIQMFQLNQPNATTIAGITTYSGTQMNQLKRPYYVILDEEMNLYVADTFNHRIMRFNRL